MVRANSVASRSSAFDVLAEERARIGDVGVVETSYSSRNCMHGFAHSTLFALTSLNSILATERQRRIATPAARR